MRKRSGQSRWEKAVFGVIYLAAAVIAVILVVNIIRNDPDSASAAISAVCYVIAAAFFVGAVALIQNSRTSKFKELKNIEKNYGTDQLYGRSVGHLIHLCEGK